MKSTDPLAKETLLAKASTADVYTWGDGQVLKLFHERTPWHANEVTATKFVHKIGFPVPEVIDGLIEVGEREGIVFEWVDGPIMREYIEERPDEVENCAKQAAELHVQFHSTEVSDLPPLVDILIWSIGQAEPLGEKTRKAVLDVLDELLTEEMLTHNDFYPNNIIMSSQGPVVIDWAIGTRGSPLADLARTWLISKLWIDGLENEKATEQLQLVWERYWKTYFRHYSALHPFNMEDFIQWQIVAVTASLVWGPPVVPKDKRVPFVKAALSDGAHPWLI